MSVEQLCQWLVGPPFKVPEERLPFIRISFIKKVYDCRRDENGVAMVQGEELPWVEKFKATWATRGANSQQVEQLLNAWRDHVGNKRPHENWKAQVDRVMGEGWQHRQQATSL